MSVTLYKAIHIGRSDGELDIRTKKHGKENNGPSNDQLDKVANPDEYYELLGPDHPVAIEWKRVLGGMLQQEKGVRGAEPWMLVTFPENYRLYKHIKSGHDHAGESSKAVKSSAKVVNGSEDAYLYGYPIGRKKRFRSAIEYFPHFLWLAEGKSEDYADCTCKHCAPDWVQKIEPLPGRDGFVPAKSEGSPVKKEISQAKKESVPVKKDGAQLKRETNVVPKVVIKQRSGSQDNKMPKPPTRTPQPPASAAPRAPAPILITPTALPPGRSEEQAVDAQYGKFIYRAGELTWFNRGTAWGLSIIVKRDLFKDQQNRDRPRYLVQPLSHPFHHPELKIITSEEDLRPWLAWSAPGVTHQPLITPNYNYNNVNWKAMLEGQYGSGDAEVDGSIFAAKMIDDSFTLLEPLSNNTTTTGERSYNALYLGGEKIWVGEPVRLRINQGQDIMVIHQIVEKLRPGSTNIELASILVSGDIYRYATLPSTTGPLPPTTAYLPLRLRQDLDYRNHVTSASKNTVSYWKIIQSAARLSIGDLKGRWYESSILLPILHGADNFARDIQRGEVTEVGNWINGRGDANQAANKLGSRYKTRIEAFGRAVPGGTQISKATEGVKADGPIAAQAPMAPAATTVEIGAKPVQGVSDGDIEQFMDLDRMEDGFAQNFVGQDGPL